MDLIQKWNAIVNWQKSNLELDDEEIVEILNEPITQKDINTIEEILGEKLPDSFIKFYLNGNGQPENYPLFFGLKFLNSNDIIEQLEHAKSLIKPEKQILNYPEKSQEVLKKIVELYVSDAIKDGLFEFNKSWYKIEFSFGLNVLKGPYLYRTENANSKEREIFRISDYQLIQGLIEEIHKLEYESYNWDEINVLVFADGKFQAERTNYNDDETSFISEPERAIKKKHFKNKWISIFSDYGGNFIGLDLDPDIKGKKGQIINFGRDEQKMFVIADDLEQFFDFVISEFNKNNGESFKTENHFIDVLRKLKKYH